MTEPDRLTLIRQIEQLEDLLVGAHYNRADDIMEMSASAYRNANGTLMQIKESEREWWQHVIRISELSGVRRPSVLRHSVPTEITDGSGEAGQAVSDPRAPERQQEKASGRDERPA